MLSSDQMKSMTKTWNIPKHTEELHYVNIAPFF